MTHRAHNAHRMAWHLVVGALLFALVVGYLWQVNGAAQHTFSIQKLGEQQQSLQEEVRDLHWQLAGVRSLAATAQRAESLKLAAPASVTYVETGFSTVAAYDPNSL